MNDEIQEFWDKRRRIAADELSMPAGEFGAVFIAAIFLLIFLFATHAWIHA